MAALHVHDVARIAHEINRMHRSPTTGLAWGDLQETHRAYLYEIAQRAMDNPKITMDALFEDFVVDGQVVAVFDNWENDLEGFSLLMATVGALRPFVED